MNHSTQTEHSETDQPTIRRSSGWLSVLPSLLTPICIGMALYFLLAWAIKKGHIADEMMLRYLTGHAVSKVTVGMFFVGATSLFLIAYNVFEQFCAEKNIRLAEFKTTSADLRRADSIRGFEEESAHAIEHGEQLLEMPRWTQTHYLWNRLVQTLHFIYRTGSVSGVEDEMKYLAELDLDRSYQRYSLARILIWATPMLGFLGTVLGISQALGGISPGPDNNFQAMMNGLQSNLYVAFDTTALALTLSMVLMFGQFLVERFEVQLLQLVDQRTRREISDHYDMTMASAANGSFDKIGREVLEATREVVTNQTKIWKKTIHAAEEAWTASLTQTGDIVRSGLSTALEENVANLADYLGQAIDKSNQSTVFRWEQWQTMLSGNARLMKEHQDQMIAQTKSVHSLVGQLDDSAAYKEALKQQQAAIKATTKMHDVLAKVACALEDQGVQLKEQTSAQAKIVKQSADLIEKSGEAFEAQRQRRLAEPREKVPMAVPQNFKAVGISVAEAQTLQAVSGPTTAGTASHDFKVKPAAGTVPTESTAPVASAQTAETNQHKRRRDPNKPVMFIRSEAVTAMREQPAAVPARKAAEALTAEALPVEQPRATDALGISVISSESTDGADRSSGATISIQAFKQSQQNAAARGGAGLVMPDARTMEERARYRTNLRISAEADARGDAESAFNSKRAA